ARIVTGSDDGTTRVWDASIGTEVLQFKGNPKPVRAVAITPDGGRIISGSDDGTARVWDASTGTEGLQLGHPWPGESVAVTSDGTRIITGGRGGMRVWSAAAKDPRPQPNAVLDASPRSSVISALAAMPDGTHIVTGNYDGAWVWDLLQLRPKQPWHG